MKRPLLGALDAWALLGVSGGLAAASPWLAGLDLPALGGIATAAAGGAALAVPRLRRRYDRVDEGDKEGFVVKSDPPLQVTEDRSILLGYTTDRNIPVRLPYDLLTRHAALIGASGGGKTSLGLLLLWQQMARGGGWTFIDAKIEADNLASVVHMARVLGRESDLYVLDISDPDHSHTYNPIAYGDADEVASRLLNLIPSAENNPGADHYRQSVNHALTAIVGGLKAAQRLYHFGDLTILMQSPGAMDAVLRMVPPGPERMALEVFLDKYRRPDQKTGQVSLDINRLKDTLGGMAGRLALFAQGKFGRLLNTYTPEVDLYEILTSNKMLYIRLPTMAKETAALNFAKMLLSDLRSGVARVQAMAKSQRPNPPHLVFADEMGSYVMPGVARFFEQARSANVAIMPGFQAFGNLREVSPEFADIILQNTWTKVMFRFGGADSAETAAEIIGKRKVFAYSLSQSENESESSPFIRATPQSSTGQGGGTGETWRENEEYRVAPAKLAALGIGECITIIGSRVYHLRIPYLQTPTSDTVEFRPLRHPRRTPAGWQTLDLEKKYSDYLSA